MWLRGGTSPGHLCDFLAEGLDETGVDLGEGVANPPGLVLGGLDEHGQNVGLVEFLGEDGHDGGEGLQRVDSDRVLVVAAQVFELLDELVHDVLLLDDFGELADFDGDCSFDHGRLLVREVVELGSQLLLQFAGLLVDTDDEMDCGDSGGEVVLVVGQSQNQRQNHVHALVLLHLLRNHYHALHTLASNHRLLHLAKLLQYLQYLQ